MQKEGKQGNLHHWRCQKLHLTKAKNKLVTAGLVSELDGQDHLLYNLSYPKCQLSQHSA